MNHYREALAERLVDRVSFVVGDAPQVTSEAPFDLVTIFEALHPAHPTVARWAAAAGFTGFEVLAIDNPLWRFYHLHG